MEAWKWIYSRAGTRCFFCWNRASIFKVFDLAEVNKMTKQRCLWAGFSQRISKKKKKAPQKYHKSIPYDSLYSMCEHRELCVRKMPTFTFVTQSYSVKSIKIWHLSKKSSTFSVAFMIWKIMYSSTPSLFILLFSRKEKLVCVWTIMTVSKW